MSRCNGHIYNLQKEHKFGMQEFCDDENTKIYAVAFSVIKSFVL
jgi:hypothetical protein